MRLFWRAGLTAFVLLSLWVILTQHLGRVQGRWVAWAEDDAMVSMQVGRHLVEGQGLVWTSGERVEGYSNLGWVLVMAVGQFFWPHDLAALWPLLLNIAFGLWAIRATRRLALALGADEALAVLGALGLALSHELIWNAASGLEGVALAALMAEAWASLAEMEAGKRTWGLRPFGMAALAVFLRFDGLVFAVLLLALAWRGAPRRLWTRGSLAVLLLFAGLEGWRWQYYGAWAPNTVLLKSGAWDGRWQAGLNYVLRWSWDWGLALVLALSAWRWRALRPWLLGLLCIAAYGLGTAGDFFPGTRYLAPAWPLIWALSAAALARWDPRKGAWAALAAVVLSYNAVIAYPGLMQGGKAAHLGRIAAAFDLQGQLKPGETLACAWAGAAYYFCDARGIDLLGKADPVVARSEPDPWLGGTGHNKMDLAYSLGVRRPDWVLFLPPGHAHSARYDEVLAKDPLFNAHCAGQAQRAGQDWLLCRCRW